MRMTRTLAGLVAGAVLLSPTLTPMSYADGPVNNSTSKKLAEIRLAASKERRNKAARTARDRLSSRGTTERAGRTGDAAWKDRQKKAAELARSLAALEKLGAVNGGSWNSCDQTVTYCSHAPGLVLSKAPDLPAVKQVADQAPPPIPGEVIAYSALARLTLNAPKPVIGPPPSINRWRMAAVGYPLWLSVDGATDPGPVTDTALDLTVSLDPHLTKVVFDMGDGHRVTCTDVTHDWSRGVRPGTPSPSCGYTYQKPSLPRGSYTVTAQSYWAVDWRTADEAGTLNLVQAAEVALPVGELQVVVR